MTFFTVPTILLIALAASYFVVTYINKRSFERSPYAFLHLHKGDPSELPKRIFRRDERLYGGMPTFERVYINDKQYWLVRAQRKKGMQMSADNVMWLTLHKKPSF